MCRGRTLLHYSDPWSCKITMLTSNDNTYNVLGACPADGAVVDQGIVNNALSAPNLGPPLSWRMHSFEFESQDSKSLQNDKL